MRPLYSLTEGPDSVVGLSTTSTFTQSELCGFADNVVVVHSVKLIFEAAV